ncbi:MAG: redox-regulated ATPase YchF [Candidatus Omnitrophota bacterium]|nr:MAG: redox-regulated ATPase YchF [Candidatus Omnitrophota bacterium]
MKIVLCGLSSSGKSTVFKALVGGKTQSKTSGKVQLNIATLDLKDERLKRLAELVGSQKVTYPQVTLVDLGYLQEASSGAIDTGSLREFDALCVVIGLFASDDPSKDLKSITSELILADLQSIQNRIEKINKERKSRPKKEQDPELLLLQRLSEALEKEKRIKDLELKTEELKTLAGFELLTLKPMIVVANISEEQLSKKGWIELEKEAGAQGLKFLPICAEVEAEIEDLSEEERPQFLKEMGLLTLSRDKFIQTCFQALDEILFFTVVGKEARAWAVPSGSSALEAAGSVHSDMQRGFIRAEVINYKDFVECGSFAKAKEKGLLRLESKEYPVQDGDIINFKFSV